MVEGDASSTALLAGQGWDVAFNDADRFCSISGSEIQDQELELQARRPKLPSEPCDIRFPPKNSTQKHYTKTVSQYL